MSHYHYRNVLKSISLKVELLFSLKYATECSRENAQETDQGGLAAGPGPEVL